MNLKYSIFSSFFSIYLFIAGRRHLILHNQIILISIFGHIQNPKHSIEFKYLCLSHSLPPSPSRYSSYDPITFTHNEFVEIYRIDRMNFTFVIRLIEAWTRCGRYVRDETSTVRCPAACLEINFFIFLQRELVQLICELMIAHTTANDAMDLMTFGPMDGHAVGRVDKVRMSNLCVCLM